MTGIPLTPELLRARSEIKARLGPMYEAYWSICDDGEFFQVPIPDAPSHRLRPRNLLLRSGSTVLRFSYQHFIERSALALAANITANNIEEEGPANHFRIIVRNREVSDATRSFFRFLDQAAYHLHEVSGRTLLPAKNVVEVSFRKLEHATAKGSLRGSRRIATAAKEIATAARASLTDDGWQLLRDFRNVDTHRYVVGIDHIVSHFGSTRSDESVRTGGRVLSLGNPAETGYALFAEPDVRFATLEPLVRISMQNAKGVLGVLARRRLVIRDGN